MKSKLYGILMRREGSACMERESNTRIQWPIAAPGRVSWYKVNPWRSAIDGLKRGEEGRGEMGRFYMLR